MPKKKYKVSTVRVPTTLAVGLVELIDEIIADSKTFKSRSDFLEKGAYLLIDRVITLRGKYKEK